MKQNTLKKQNIYLIKELEQYRKKIKQCNINDKKQKEELQGLITSLNDLRKEWYKLNAKLKEKSEYCEQILVEINSIKNAILSNSIKFVIKRVFHTIVYSFKKSIKNIFS